MNTKQNLLVCTVCEKCVHVAGGEFAHSGEREEAVERVEVRHAHPVAHLVGLPVEEAIERRERRRVGPERGARRTRRRQRRRRERHGARSARVRRGARRRRSQQLVDRHHDRQRRLALYVAQMCGACCSLIKLRVLRLRLRHCFSEKFVHFLWTSK